MSTIETRLQRLERILAISRELTSTVALESLLEKIVTTTAELTDSEGAFILLPNTRTGELCLYTVTGNPTGQLADIPVTIEGSIAGTVLTSGKPLIVPNARANPPHYEEVGWQIGFEARSLLAVPLRFNGRCIGVLEVANKQGDQGFSQEDVGTLMTLATQATVAIENARLFEMVEQQREQLRILTARLAEAEEAERQQLARELHDLLGQDLTLLGLNLNTVRMRMPREATGPVCARLDDSLALVDQIAQRIRDVMAGLRPPALDDHGLVAALRRYGEQFASRTGIVVTVQDEESVPRLATPVENGLFRITQEALTNVAKHAQATQVTVAVEANDGIVRLVVSDDGIGFDPARLAGPDGGRGWGLLIMAERAEALGGRCRIESRLRQGTQVVVEVERRSSPCPPQSPHPHTPTPPHFHTPTLPHSTIPLRARPSRAPPAPPPPAPPR